MMASNEPLLEQKFGEFMANEKLNHQFREIRSIDSFYLYDFDKKMTSFEDVKQLLDSIKMQDVLILYESDAQKF